MKTAGDYAYDRAVATFLSNKCANTMSSTTIPTKKTDFSTLRVKQGIFSPISYVLESK